jgi:hypothetical protein
MPIDCVVLTVFSIYLNVNFFLNFQNGKILIKSFTLKSKFHKKARCERQSSPSNLRTGLPNFTSEIFHFQINQCGSP